MAESASEIESDTAEKMKIYQEKFEDFNKNFNPEEMGKDRMSFKSFKKIMKGIKCLKNVKVDSIFENEATEGTPEKYIDFQQFTRCLDKEIETEASVCQDFKEQALEQIRKLYPKDVSKKLKVKSILAKMFRFGDSIKDVSSAAGVTLKEIAKTTVEALSAVGTGVQWIGPVIGVLKVLWERFEAFESIKEDAAKFADTLLYLSDTVAFIGSNELYHTDMMKTQMVELKKILDQAEKLWKKVDGHKDKKAKRFFTAKEDCKNLEGMMKDMEKWVLLTLFLQSAENQETTLKIKAQLDKVQNTSLENKFGIAVVNQKLDALTLLVVKCLQEFLKETHHDQRERIKGELKAAGIVITEEDNHVATASGEGINRSISVTYEPSLSPEHLRPCDFLIYHDYDDKDLALDIQRELTEKMKPSRFRGREERVKVRILDEFQSEGVQQEQLEKALNLASVKLILVTRKLAQLKGLEYHHLEIFSILRKSRSGQVFALRVDKNYKDYINQLDFYVQGLLEGCFYEPHREDFVERMFQVFKRNIMTRIEREKKEEEKAREKQRMQEMIKEKIEEKKKAEKDKEFERILDDPNNTLEDLERLQKQVDEMKVTD